MSVRRPFQAEETLDAGYEMEVCLTYSRSSEAWQLQGTAGRPGWMERGEAGREEQKVRPGPYCSVEGKANCGLAEGLVTGSDFRCVLETEPA